MYGSRWSLEWTVDSEHTKSFSNEARDCRREFHDRNGTVTHRNPRAVPCFLREKWQLEEIELVNMPVIVPRPWASTSASTWWLSSSHGSAQCQCLCTSAGTTSVSYSSLQAYIMGRHQVRTPSHCNENGKYVN